MNKDMAPNTNAFDWGNGPSVVAGDRTFAPDSGGLSRAQRATLNVEKRKAQTGWCPGVIWGLSAKADKQVNLRKRKEPR